MTTTEQSFRELIGNKRKFIETLLVVENKDRQQVPFIYNPIQADVDKTQTGMDIWVKPSSVGFSTERICNRLVDTLTNPGTNTVLVAFEDFVTERLLSKVTFFYNYLDSLGIPDFPCIHHNSTYEKTFEFMENGRVVSTSSIYIASARSKTAGRAEVIHHLLLDEHAFYIPQAQDNIIAPAFARVPPNGTVDSFSTPNGRENDFYTWYTDAKDGKSVFTSHFYTWFMHPEYVINLGDPRVKKDIPETDKVEFHLESDEERLMFANNLTFPQIRWRRWMKKVMDTLKRKGEIQTLFPQEFPEDDVSCFLTTGNMYYEGAWVEKGTKTCYDAPYKMNGLNVWHRPEVDEQGRPTKTYLVIVDPGQAKITQSVISVMTFDKDEMGNTVPVWCARDSGWYDTEVEYEKACAASDYYHRAMIVWEANGHGLGFTVLAKNRRPIYFRKDLINGYPTMMPGWYTSGGKSGTKEFMLQQVHKFLPSLICNDIELWRQITNFRLVAGKLEIVGLDDIHDTLAIGLCVFNPNPVKRGLQGQTGWKPGWGMKGAKRRKHSVLLRR